MIRPLIIVVTLFALAVVGCQQSGPCSEWVQRPYQPEVTPDPDYAKYALPADQVGAIKFIDPYYFPYGPGWIALSNGRDLTGWVARKKSVPMSWQVINGIMINQPAAGHKGTDLYTEMKFKDFEIYYEYKIPAGGNSGLYLRGRYEVQINDTRGRKPETWSNGGVYGQVAPSREVSHRPDEWQTVYARLVGRKLTVILNEATIIDGYTLTGPTGGALDTREGEPGPILIQGDHGPVQFKNITIRPIQSAKGG